MSNHRIITKRIMAAAASAVIASTAFCAALPVVNAAGIPTGSTVQSAAEPSISMSLLAGGSKIGILFYVDVPGDISDYKVYLDQTEYDIKESEKGYYIEAEEYAMYMMKRHTVSIEKDGEEVLSKTVSVCGYLNEIIGSSAYEAYVPLAKAMLMYGGAAQEYFRVDAKDSPSDGITGADYSDVVIDAEPFDKAAFNETLEGSPVKYYGMNLSLRSETRFTLFFELEDGADISEAADYLSGFTFGGSTASVRQNGTKYLEVSIDVPAFRLGDDYELTNGTVKAAFSPAQYLAAAAADDDEKLAAVCKALYAYGEAALAASDIEEPAAEKWASGQTYSGYATVYDLVSQGCANLDSFASEFGYETCALSVPDYAGSEMAGAYLELKDSSGNAAYLLVTDRDGNDQMQAGDVDIEQNIFTQGSSLTSGKVAVTWRVMPLPSAEDANVRYSVKNGSSIYWCEIQVQNHRYPVAKLEYKNSSGEFEELSRKDYNYFAFPEGASLNGGVTLRITDIFGETLVDENVDLKLTTSGENVPEPYTVPGGVQFAK